MELSKIFMRRKSLLLLAVSGLVGLLAIILVAAVLLVFVNANAYKPQLEASISQTLGMEVKIKGPLGISFFPGLLLTLQDVHIANHGMQVASVAEVKLGIEVFPLLQKKVRIDSIALQHPAITIEREPDGGFNFVSAATTRVNLPILNLSNVSLADGSLHYVDKQSGGEFEAESCNLQVRHLQFSQGKSVDLMKRLAFTADLACGELRENDFTASDLKVSASGKNGVFDLQPVTVHIFGARATGGMHADFTGAVAHYSSHYSLPQFQIAEFFKALSPQKVAEGRMDFSANLSLQGRTVADMRRTLEGQISLRGKNLTLEGQDLDKEISRFESSQHFNLVDIGAVFFAGPLGLVVTKGYNFASLGQGSGGNSQIRTLVSDWKIEHGVAQAQDVAMTTNKNRIALQGGLNFIDNKFDNVTVALINVKGCATVRQKISGSFQKPVVENQSLVKSLTGPVWKLLKMGRDIFPGGKCEVFYAGSVAPPK
ncbi:MAG: AsmA family protein [Gammaproteobacteria bacterium]